MKRAELMSCCATIGLLCFSAPAQAQDGDDKGTVSSSSDIVVTGSRISRRDFVAESPVTTYSEQSLQMQGPATISQSLNQLPQFAAGDGGPTASGAKQGRASANLRGLGITRTLVLLDGRRLQPSDALGTIDLNTIPVALLESVEVITGGASATYGSDAISGVVNFKLKRDFTGLVGDVQAGISERGDARTFDVSLAAGTTFADGRGSLMAAASYYDREGVYGRQRDFFIGKGIAGNLRGGVIQGVANNLPSQAALNAVFVDRYGASVNPVRNQAIGLNRDGTLFTSTSPILNYRYADHDPYILDGTSRVGFPLGESYYLQAPLERYNAFAKAEFEVASDITLYAQGLYTKYNSNWTRDGNTATSASAIALIPVTNPFITPDLAEILASRPNPTAPINFAFNTGGVGPTVSTQDYRVYQVTAGVRGKLAADINFDLYASFGRTKLKESQNGYIDREAWSTLVNAADGGASVCEGGYNPFSPDPLFGNPAKKGCYDFLNRELFERTVHSQRVIEGMIEGGLATLPGGEMRFAVGAAYRENEYDFNPDAARVNRTVYPDQATGPASGSVNVKEVFGELLVPIVKDLPVLQELSLNLAYRYSDYNRLGGVQTYKATGDWNVFGGFRIRGGYQRAVRAPNLAEMFAPPERSLPQVGSVASGAGDYCDITSALRVGPDAAQVRALCLAQGVPDSVIDSFRFTGSAWPAVSSGNLNLKEEAADTYTIGATWSRIASSPFFRGLTLSVDYYNIHVKNAIGQITPGIANTQCFNRNGGNPGFDPSNLYCGLLRRDPATGQVDLFTQQTQNLGAFKMGGVDTQLDWKIALNDLGIRGSNAGTISLNIVASYLDQFEIKNTPDAPFINFAGTIGNSQVDAYTLSYPKWKVTGTIGYDNDAFGIALRGKYFDSMNHYAAVGVENSTLRGVVNRYYFDLSGRFNVEQNFQLRFGVLNLFDKQPPEWVSGSLSDPALYDILQRRYYIGVNTKF